MSPSRLAKKYGNNSLGSVANKIGDVDAHTLAMWSRKYPGVFKALCLHAAAMVDTDKSNNDEGHA